MSNNKLKNMIDNHELDDFVNNEDLKEKLCKLQTSEEVLELLKKYNYNESKEILEVELMDLLKEFVGEEKLLKVSGGKLNKQSFSNIVTSLAITGSLCMPVQGVTGVQQKEKREDKKSSYSIRLPKKEEVGLGVGVILGVGVLLEEVLRRNILTRKADNIERENNTDNGQIHKELTEENYTEMRDHFLKIATTTDKYNIDDLEKYEIEQLRDFIFYVLEKWVREADARCVCQDFGNGLWYGLKTEKPENVMVWGTQADSLLAARIARAALLWKCGNISENEMRYLLNNVYYAQCGYPAGELSQKAYQAGDRTHPENTDSYLPYEVGCPGNLKWYGMTGRLDCGSSFLDNEITYNLIAVSTLSKPMQDKTPTWAIHRAIDIIGDSGKTNLAAIERMKRLFANTEFSKSIGYKKIMEAIDKR